MVFSHAEEISDTKSEVTIAPISRKVFSIKVSEHMLLLEISVTE